MKFTMCETYIVVCFATPCNVLNFHGVILLVTFVDTNLTVNKLCNQRSPTHTQDKNQRSRNNFESIETLRISGKSTLFTLCAALMPCT